MCQKSCIIFGIHIFQILGMVFRDKAFGILLCEVDLNQQVKEELSVYYDEGFYLTSSWIVSACYAFVRLLKFVHR